MDQDHFSKIKIILINTTHSGNIGAAARAMKTMGLSQLTLVNPCPHLNHEAIARASGADDILENAQLVDNLADAIADCVLVMGTSGRSRSLEWPTIEPEIATSQIIDTIKTQEKSVALVFGRERDGLTNEELQLCQARVCIPTQDNFKSLNLAQAVQILCYELRKNSIIKSDTDYINSTKELVTAQQTQGLIEHLTEVAESVGYLSQKQPKQFSKRLRRFFTRANLENSEVNILRGLLTSIQNKMAVKIN